MDITFILKELKELWEFLNNYDGKDNSEFTGQSFLFHQYFSIVSYTCAALIRDFEKDLADRDRDLCEYIIFNLGYLLLRMSYFEFAQADNGVDAITLGLILLLNKENKKQ